MTKPNNANHRAKCQRYKNSGRRETNKKLRQERYEKKMEKFRRRREERNAITAETVQPKKTNKKNRRKNVEETPPYGNKLEIQKWTSIMRKLDNYLEEIKKANKERVSISNHTKHHKHDDVDIEE